MSKELEVKLEIPPTALSPGKVPLLRTLTNKRAEAGRAEVSVYFDSHKHRLRKHHLSLRVRRIGKRHVQTIKATGAGPFERGEWEREIDGDQPDLDATHGTALEPLLTKKVSRQLQPVFETVVQRRTYLIEKDGCEIALSIDRGQINTGNRSVPLREMELELKRGGAAALFKLAAELAAAMRADLLLRSKSERGYELLCGNTSAAKRAEMPATQPGTTSSNAFRLVAQACLKQVIDNKPGVIESDAESIHQMRVGLRRLRTVISLFSNILSRNRETESLKRELVWLTGELGPARELHVICEAARTLREQQPRARGLSILARDLAARYSAALVHARSAVQTDRFRDLTWRLLTWSELGEWAQPQDDLLRDRGARPIEASARAELSRGWKKIRRKGKVLAELDARSRHKLRIRLKKLRYATDFFQAAFPGAAPTKRRHAFASQLKVLQSCLGDLNDITVHERLMSELAGDPVRTPPHVKQDAKWQRKGRGRRAFAAGYMAGQEEARFDDLIASAARAYAACAKIEPFWK